MIKNLIRSIIGIYSVAAILTPWASMEKDIIIDSLIEQKKSINSSKISSLHEQLPKIQKLEEVIIDGYIDSIYEDREISDIINKNFVKSIIDIESEGDMYAESEKGARGLMQIMEETWESVEKELDFHMWAFFPHENLKVGIKYLNEINNYCESKHPRWDKLSTEDKHFIIAAAYNGGIGRLKGKNWDISRMPYETRNYVKKVENRF